MLINEPKSIVSLKYVHFNVFFANLSNTILKYRNDSLYLHQNSYLTFGIRCTLPMLDKDYYCYLNDPYDTNLTLHFSYSNGLAYFRFYKKLEV